MNSADTIAALASAPGRGAIGIIRISGAEVPRIATAMLGSLPTPRSAELKHFVDADGTASMRGWRCTFRRRIPSPASMCSNCRAMAARSCFDLLLQRALSLAAARRAPENSASAHS